METTGRGVVIGLLAFAVCLATSAVLLKPTVRLKPKTPTLRPLIAVLPFENLEGDSELEALAADVTDAVIRGLEDIEEIRVLTHASTLSYRGIEGGASEIASKLGADYVLAGSVETEPEGLRLQAYFVKPGERPRIWADEFRFGRTDTARIPAELAAYIQSALTDSEALPEGRPGSPAARE